MDVQRIMKDATKDGILLESTVFFWNEAKTSWSYSTFILLVKVKSQVKVADILGINWNKAHT